jgi:cytochrome c nitrite reductase small subunit
MTNDPAACANCHVMREQFEAWGVSSHRAVAVCNDCHAPHTLVAKYLTKALNGFHHSVAFTTGQFHEPIAIGPRNRAITEAACRHCHADLVESIEAHAPAQPPARRELACTRCHDSVGHLH